MSKFKNVKIQGKGNIVGDGNVIHNTNIHNHKTTRKKSDIQPEGVFAFLIFAGVVLTYLYHGFFTNFSTINQYLNIASYTSPILGIAGVLILYYKNQLESFDLIKIGLLLIIGVVCLFTLRENIDPTLIELVKYAQQVDSLNWYDQLNENGKVQSQLIVTSTAFVFLSLFLNHLASLVLFNYSMSNVNQVGFWFKFFNKLKIFKPEFGGTAALILVIAALVIVKFYR